MTGPEEFTPGPIADRRRDFTRKLRELTPMLNENRVMMVLKSTEFYLCQTLASHGHQGDIPENIFNYTVEQNAWRNACQLAKLPLTDFPYPDQPPTDDATCRASQIWRAYRMEHGGRPATTTSEGQGASSSTSAPEAVKADEAAGPSRKERGPDEKPHSPKGKEKEKSVSAPKGSKKPAIPQKWVQGPGSDKKHYFPGTPLPTA
ncbi:hypothetical protein F4779DRAFT_360950, partial [Xylariaceae sp. FL0662B]